LEAGQVIEVSARKADGEPRRFKTISRLDSPVDLRYYENGGILHTVLRDIMRREAENEGV
ncbi:MAG: hypothetical protein KDB72_24180, partial [Mycobacterium sp.]|nr:hypothetical protein [Mycobacterium sp.]